MFHRLSSEFFVIFLSLVLFVFMSSSSCAVLLSCLSSMPHPALLPLLSSPLLQEISPEICCLNDALINMFCYDRYYEASSLSSTMQPVLSLLLTMQPVLSPLLTMQPVLSPLLCSQFSLLYYAASSLSSTMQPVLSPLLCSQFSLFY